MDNINTLFFEEYKRADKLCCEIYNSDKGITSYIDDMQNESSSYKKDVPEWYTCLETLQKLRYKRNILAHEADTFDIDMIDESELEFIKEFRKSLLERSDPIAKLEKIKQEKKSIAHRSQNTQYAAQQNDTKNNDNNSIYFVCLSLLILFMIFLIQAFFK